MAVPQHVSSAFLQSPPSDWVASNDLAFATRSPAGASPGHTLVVPRRCIASYFDATAAEKTALWALVDEVKLPLDAQLHPDGYSISFDTIDAAGQTVLHLHIHIIPRFHAVRASGGRELRRRTHAVHPSRPAASTTPSATTSGPCSTPPRRSPSWRPS